jgi:hypothetical protein
LKLRPTSPTRGVAARAESPADSPATRDSPATSDSSADSPVSWRAAFLAAFPAWLAARAIVLLALGLARYLVDHAGVTRTDVISSAHQGLSSWDASWYAQIAAKGYTMLPRESVRFFPLLPLVTHAISVTGIDERAVLIGIENACALLAGVLLYRVVRREGGDSRLATRAAWLLAIAPPAYVFVMGYVDATAVVLALLVFLAVRQQRWGWAAVAGVAVGLCRPTGFLLAVPALIEAWRGFDTAQWRDRVLRAAAVVAPVAGTLVYLGWVGGKYGDMLLPYRVQATPQLHGAFADPLSTVYDAAKGAFHGHVGTGLHVPWLLLIIGLTVVACRKWPAAYGAFAVVVVASAITSKNLDSLERYALFAFPLVMAAANLTESQRVERAVFVVSAAAMFGYATLAFLGLLVP